MDIQAVLNIHLMYGKCFFLKAAFLMSAFLRWRSIDIQVSNVGDSHFEGYDTDSHVKEEV